MQHFLTLLAFFCIINLSAARAIRSLEEIEQDANTWMYEEFDPMERRDDTCGGVANFIQCGGSFPSDVCCAIDTQCLLLNTTSNIQATLCCPAGQDCQTINPISCDIDLQDTSQNPGSPLHSDPPTNLEQCGDSCCPMGYQCRNSLCVALTAAEAASGITSSDPTLLPTAPATIASPSSTSDSSSGVTITPLPASETLTNSNSGWFSGKSFAAGFVPGIAVGSLIAAGLIIFMLRKERRQTRDYTSEKHLSSGRDTLTDLGPDLSRRPTVHGRSISEPTVDMSLGHRTEFLKYSPPRDIDQRDSSIMQGYIVNVQTPSNASIDPSSHGGHEASNGAVWPSRSPIMTSARTPVPTQSPLPDHLKRGTLSFRVSPIRALKKQKSVHSLRRQMTELSNRSNSSRRRKRDDLSRSDSTETIKVLMDTPLTQPRTNPATLPSSTFTTQQPHPPASIGTWETTNSSTNSAPIEEQPNTYTPTRPGRNSNVDRVGATLSSPYTPSNYPPKKDAGLSKIPLSSLLTVDNNTQNSRDSTFSAIMEKVGLRKTLLMGPETKNANSKA